MKDDIERVKILYGHEIAAGYPPTGADRPGYTTYLQALTEGCTGKNLRVLELGCGTGRYFHCLSNLAFLMGVDLSMDMLQVAGYTMQDTQTLTGAICILLQADFHSLRFAPGSFDFIYSIGTLGEYALFDLPFLDYLVQWLTVGGRAFFTIVDRLAYQQENAKSKRNLKEIIKQTVAASPFLRFVNPRLAQRLVYSYDFSHLYMSQGEVLHILKSCSFPIQFEITKFRDMKHQKIGVKLVRGAV
jgi:SAM-dependent methyltransferase